MTREKKKALIELILSMIWVFAGIYGILMLNRYFYLITGFFKNPETRLAIRILSQWIPAILPMLFVIRNRGFFRLGFSGKRIGVQILTGLGIAVVMSLLLQVLPVLLGKKEWVGEPLSYPNVYSFVQEFLYRTEGVALAEEFVFRGFVFAWLLKLKNSRPLAILISSLLFGLAHIFHGSIVQILVTTLMGVFWCLCREKLRHCTTLSLIIAHGIYGGLNIVVVSLL